MIDKGIMKELTKKKKLQTVYKLIKRIREESNYTLSKEDAAYSLAGSLGVDISKYADADVLERLRKVPTSIRVIEAKSNRILRSVSIKIQGIPLKVPHLPNSMYNDCKKMSEVYQIFFLLENSIRYFIIKILHEKFPSDKRLVNKFPQKSKNNIEARMKRAKENRWHSRQNAEHIFYSDFSDLSDIITNNWECFRDYFPNQSWIKSKLGELELSRNIIAHNNVLHSSELKRIKLYFNDWCKQIGGK